MKIALILPTALCLFSSHATAMSLSEIPWPEQACTAYAVVVGTISKINAHYISIVQEQAKPPYKLYYDSAQLEGVRVLKSRSKLSGPQLVMFPSRDQPKKLEFAYPARKFSEGETGVWFLYSAGIAQAFLVGRPFPMTDEEAIAKVISETDCEKRRWPNHLLDRPAAQ